MKKQEIIKLAGYFRKSSEDNDRQILSIPAQIPWAENLVARLGLEMQEIFKEERSATTPYRRPEFDNLVAKIRSGTINAIVCWKLDRLARNPEEAGIILGLLKRGELKRIITNDREYRPEDNTIISYVDFGMADQFSRDLSKNVKRGLWQKASAGERPGALPLGYIQKPGMARGEAVNIPDPDRFELVERMFHLFLAGTYSVRELQRETVKWGLKTRQTKRQGGKDVSISQIYNMLGDPFYCRLYWWMNNDTGEIEQRIGNHKAMITEEEHEIILRKLGNRRKSRPKNKNKQLPYLGKMECGECGCAVTGEDKYQIICTICKRKSALTDKRKDCPGCSTKIEEMREPKILHYIYYHCTKRKNRKCTQYSVTVGQLEKIVDSAIEEFTLSEAFTTWALEELEKDTNYQIKSQNTVINSQQEQYKITVASLQNLTKLYTSPKNVNGALLSMEEYQTQREELLAEKKRLEKDQQVTGRKIEEWIDWATNSFDFATAARVWFEKGSPQQKRDIFFSLSGSNLILKDEKLGISLKKPLDFYSAIAIAYPSTKSG